MDLPPALAPCPGKGRCFAADCREVAGEEMDCVLQALPCGRGGVGCLHTPGTHQ